MKPCPVCAEEIQDAALICRHCGASATPTGWVRPGMAGAAPANTNGMAVASMVLGILGVLCLYGIGPILALVFGYLSRRQIRDSMGAQKGNGMSIAGIVLGWVGLALVVLFIVLAIIGAATDNNSSADTLGLLLR